LDTAAGVRNTGGKPDDYVETLRIFSKDAAEKIKQISECLVHDHIRNYTVYVHALKSVLANIGNPALSGTAAALEDAGNENDRAFIDDTTPYFLQELQCLTDNIDKFLKEQDGLSGQTLDASFIHDELANLKKALIELEINAVDQIIDTLKNSQVSDLIHDISECVLFSDYEKAISDIDDYLLKNN
jgi:HPt (histidine-containing phosphotransfer) domain-containing protein